MNLHWHTLVTQSPYFTLGFSLLVLSILWVWKKDVNEEQGTEGVKYQFSTNLPWMLPNYLLVQTIRKPWTWKQKHCSHLFLIYVRKYLLIAHKILKRLCLMTYRYPIHILHFTLNWRNDSCSKRKISMTH